MNVDKKNEDLLREASAYGDSEGVKVLIDTGVDINAQHSVNGWTALHWAAKRGHVPIIQYLLSHGADPNLTSVYGESAFSIAKTEDIRQMLSSGHSFNTSEVHNNSPLPIIPNYLSNPPLVEKIEMPDKQMAETSDKQYVAIPGNISNKNFRQICEEELVLKVRSSYPPNQDFIEIEIPMKNLSYENVFKVCCEELQVSPEDVQKLRKLPNTIVRKDKDVLRLHNFQELELVLNSANETEKSLKRKTNSLQSVTNDSMNNSQMPNSTFSCNSNYCKNGTILY